MKIKRRAALVVAALTIAACGSGNETFEPIKQTRQQAAVAALAAPPTPFPKNRSAYTITKTADGYIVTDTATSASTRIAGVNSIVFADMTVNLAVADKAATIADADLKSLIELYIAYFNRLPDADGLAYWIEQFKAGQSLDRIGQSFYQAAVEYSSLTGYSPTMSDADFVKIVYKNVLGRDTPDEDGLNYWKSALADGRETRGTLVRAILHSAHTFKNRATYGAIADLLDNKASVATVFAVQQGLNYNKTEESISRTMDLASAITATDSATAIFRFGGIDALFKCTTSPQSCTEANQDTAPPDDSCAVPRHSYGEIAVPPAYAGTSPVTAPAQTLPDTYVRAMDLKDIDAWFSKAASNACSDKNRYIRNVYIETLNRMQQLGVTQVWIYNYGPWDDFSKQVWTIDTADYAIPPDVVKTIVGEAAKRGIKVYLSWQMNTVDKAGGWDRQLDIGPNMTKETLSRILNSFRQQILAQARFGAEIGLAGIAADIGNFSTYPFNDKPDFRELYVSSTSQTIDDIRAVFPGKVVYGQFDSMIDPRIVNKVDAFIYTVWLGNIGIAEPISVDVVRNFVADRIEWF